MGAPFEFEYETRIPANPLRGSVELLWFARGTIPYTRERIAPTGSTVGVFVLGDPILQTANDGNGVTIRAERGFLIGPHDRPVVNEPTGETHAVGIVTTPVGCEAVFGIPPAALRAKVFDLEDVWSDAVAIRTVLLAEPSAGARLQLLEHWLSVEVPTLTRQLRRCQAAVAALQDSPTRPIAEIASDLEISHGYLDREFTRVVGLTPRSLARLLRMRGLLERIDIRSSVPWAELAAEFGWFDQAHLIRDFKRHTGVTPSHYVEAQRAAYAPVEVGDAAGFVPEV